MATSLVVAAFWVNTDSETAHQEILELIESSDLLLNDAGGVAAFSAKNVDTKMNYDLRCVYEGFMDVPKNATEARERDRASRVKARQKSVAK